MDALHKAGDLVAIRQIRIIGDPVLRKKAKKVNKIDPLTLQLLDDMAETMYAEPGIGLAAPQVGVSKRIIVVDIGEGLHNLINPKITRSEGSEIDTEACLSVPDKIGEVERFTSISVKAMNPDGKYVKFEAEELLARCIQHEIDHLDGILYVDKATNVREPEYPGEEEDLAEGGEPYPVEEPVLRKRIESPAQPAIFEVKKPGS